MEIKYQKSTILSANSEIHTTNMTPKLHSGLKLSLTAVITLSILVFTIISCTKKNLQDDGIKFVGTWKGTSYCTGATFTGTDVVINKGKDNVTLAIDINVGDAPCTATKTFSGTAFNSNATFGKQVYNDNCNGAWEASGTATISRDTLVLTWTGKSLVGGGATGVTGTCTFRGTK